MVPNGRILLPPELPAETTRGTPLLTPFLSLLLRPDNALTGLNPGLLHVQDRQKLARGVPTAVVTPWELPDRTDCPVLYILAEKPH